MKTSSLAVCVVWLTACGSHSQPLPFTPSPARAPQNANATTGSSASDQTAPVTPPVCTTTGVADVSVQVYASVGPHGSIQPVPVSNELYNTNIYDQMRSDYVPRAAETYVAYLKALHPAHLRWPAGYYSQQYTFMPDGPEGQYNLTPALLAAYMDLCRRTGAQPMITVNLENGTPQNAADLVRFVNQQMGYNIRWWEIGNEPDVDGLDGVHSPQIYANKYAAIASAMRAADPSIKLAGAVLMTGEDILGEHDDTDWLTPILQQVGPQMDAVSWHYYPLYSSQDPTSTSSAISSVDHLLQEDASDWPPAGLDFADRIMPYLRSIIAQYTPGAQVWISEFAEDPGPAAGDGLSDRAVGALWAADAIGRYAEYGTEAMYKFIFKAGPEHKYTLLDDALQPRPEYYTYWLYAQHFGDRLVDSQSSNITAVAVHSAVRAADNTLTVLLVNKLSVPQTVHLTLDSWRPTSAQQYILQSDAFTSTTMTVNGQNLTPDKAQTGGVAALHAEACTDNLFTLAPYTVQLVEFKQ